MRIDIAEEGNLKLNDELSIEIKNGKCYFTVNNDRHIFGSKLYPVGKRAHIFTRANTQKQEYSEVARYIEEIWSPAKGYCYTNAEVLWNAFKKFNIDAKYFSGWLFPASGYPVHHAFVIVENSVFDISINIKGLNLGRKQVLDGKDPYSKECIEEVKQVESQWKPIEESFIWGYTDFIYVGAENTPNGARLQYNKAVTDLSTHPSYKEMGVEGKYFESDYQRLTRG